MQVVIFIGFIVFAVAFATIIQQRFLKRISVNYIAMAIGAAIALVPQTNSLIESFSSELFMGLIVAPLLFFEGQRTRLYNVFTFVACNSWVNGYYDYLGNYNCGIRDLF